MKNNKTIGFKIRLWTNELEVINGPKGKKTAAWDSGVIFIEPNDVKGIKAKNPTPINSFEDIIPAIKNLCKENKILLVSDCRRPRIK